MRRALSRRLFSAGIAIVLLVGGGAVAGGAAHGAGARTHGKAALQTRAVCGPVKGLRARCSAFQVLNPDALVRPDRKRPRTTSTSASTTSTTQSPTTTASTTSSTSSTTSSTSSTTSTTTIPVTSSTLSTPPACTTAHAGYTPCDLRNAYALPSDSAGGGQTVAIVDAYDDPHAEADLAVYRAAYGIAPCTSATGCFRKVNQSGATSPYPAGDTGWAEEISLDLDMVSAVCPNCRILLVEARSSSLGDLLVAENEAVALGANVVSNSWGANEFRSETNYDSYFHHNIPITASTGDDGYGVSWPASSPYVTAVGGTSLHPAANARGWSETAWNGAGSGCSSREPKPAWQTGTACARRAVGDVAAVADPATGVATYDTYNVSGWLVFGGTSVAAPIIASTYALAGNGASISTPSYPYGHTSALFDVTSGSNGSCGGTYLCNAVPGYDGPTGLGTPNGTGAF